MKTEIFYFFWKVIKNSLNSVYMEKTLMLGKTEGKRRRWWQRMRWLDSITDSMDMNVGKLRRWWGTGRPGMLQSMGSQWVRHNLVSEQQQCFAFFSCDKQYRISIFFLCLGKLSYSFLSVDELLVFYPLHFYISKSSFNMKFLLVWLPKIFIRFIKPLALFMLISSSSLSSSGCIPSVNLLSTFPWSAILL